ncbi:MAG: WbqC family protein [Bacteroidota bacterium]
MSLVAVRPPEYLPRLEVAALLLAADRFVVADTFPFSRQSHHNRTRIRAVNGMQWLSVPRRHAGRPLPLAEVGVVDDGWRRRHLAAVRAAYGMAPFVDHVMPGLADLLAEPPASLGALTSATMAWVARWLDAPAEIVRASDLPGRPDRLGAVWETAGGNALVTLDESLAPDRRSLPDTPTHVLRFEEAPRRQAFAGFEDGAGVLDLLMNYGPASAGVLRAGSRTEAVSGAPPA